MLGTLFVLGGCSSDAAQLSGQSAPAITDDPQPAGASGASGEMPAAEPSRRSDAAIEDGGAAPSAGDAGVTKRAGFVHPGVLVTREQLAFVKAKIDAGAEPWTAAFTAASKSPYASLTYAPKPYAVVECGSFSNPNIGCSDERKDGTAAYTHALLWYFTGTESHAKKAIEILNAWSSTLTDHSNSNAPLQSAWTAPLFTRAAEILRSTYDGWAPAEVSAFGRMLRNVYLPKVENGSTANGNWELSMIEAAIGIGVFLDDQAIFDKAVKMWRARVPAYIYLKTDGPLPVYPPGGKVTTPDELVASWFKQETFVDGLSQETCRDLGHVQYGFAAMINAAETARLQNVDLYAAEATRITAGLELHAKFLNGEKAPSSICGGKLTDATPDPMWEIALNTYARRAGVPLPQTQAIVAAIRPTGVDHHMAWETLTHADVGNAGLPTP